MAHSNELLEGIGGTIDKIDMLFEMEYDRWQAELASLEHLFVYLEERSGISIGRRVRCYGAKKDSDRRLYGVSTWGVACDDLLQFLPSYYHPYITRVDFRIETEISEQQLAVFRDHLQEHNPKSRNIVDYNTRRRNKEFARNAGGRGVGFGSHKSDVRLTAYKRHGEPGAVEIQIGGDTIQGILLYSKQLSEEPNGISFYAAACDGIIARLYSLSTEIGFSSPLGILTMLGENEYTLSYEEHQEKNLLEAVEAFKSLSPGYQSDFLAAIGMGDTGHVVGVRG